MKTLFSLLLLTSALSASAQVQTSKNWDKLEGQHSGVTKSLAVAVQDPQTWAQIWRQHDADAPVPDVDFSKVDLVVVFLGQKETAGVKVRIVVQQDPLDSSRLNVFYSEVVSKKGFSAQVETQPYAIVKVPRAATIDIEQDIVICVPERRDAPAAAPHDDTRVHALMQGLENPSFDGN